MLHMCLARMPTPLENPRCATSIFLFSKKVVETPFKALLAGRVQTAYGTDFNCIADSARVLACSGRMAACNSHTRIALQYQIRKCWFEQPRLMESSQAPSESWAAKGLSMRRGGVRGIVSRSSTTQRSNG